MKILLVVHSEVRVIDYVRYYQEVWRNGDIAQHIITTAVDGGEW